ncbi:MAG: protein TolA [Hydrogenophilales bacterium RIFOXYD1_FULL_62_11]|nr:MAG: protein TolA [Hydrogenophilales bacterium RIFOXYD1_FULL_62_11]
MRLAADTPVSRNTDKRVAGALALGVHALFVLLLVFGVSWQTEHPAPVMVDLWQSLPAETSSPRAVSHPDPVKPGPKPVPKPAPVPKPVAEEPPPKAPDIALEKKRAETERQKKLKAIQQAEAKAREASARAEADALQKARDKQTEQKKQAMLRQMEADELKQSMVNEASANAARAAKQAEAQAAGARQAALSQTIGKYRDLISATVRGNTRLPDNLKGNPQVRCLVKVLPTGDVVSVRVTQSSGNAAYDAAVVRAIEKSSPLPLPTEREARAAFVPELSFTHRPQE